MGKDLISIIVPVYNVERYVQQCVTSIMNQTYKKLQIILVDDGSTDGSGKKCDELALIDERIEVIHKKNGGLSDARNAGIDCAMGTFIGFVDSDDYIEEDMYEVLYNAIIRSEADFASCGYYEEYIDKAEIKRCCSEVKVLDRTSAYTELFSREGSLGCSSCGKLFNRRLFDNMRYKKGIQSEDLELIYRIIDKSNRVTCVNAIKYHYVHRENSITTSLAQPQIMDPIRTFNDIILFIKRKYPEVLELAYAYQLSWIVGIYRTINPHKENEYKVMREELRNIMCKNIKHYWGNKYAYWADKLLMLAAILHIFSVVKLAMKAGVTIYHKTKMVE